MYADNFYSQNTKVLMKDGTYKLMSEIQLGDELFSIGGQDNKVDFIRVFPVCDTYGYNYTIHNHSIELLDLKHQLCFSLKGIMPQIHHLDNKFSLSYYYFYKNNFRLETQVFSTYEHAMKELKKIEETIVNESQFIHLSLYDYMELSKDSQMFKKLKPSFTISGNTYKPEITLKYYKKETFFQIESSLKHFVTDNLLIMLL